MCLLQTKLSPMLTPDACRSGSSLDTLSSPQPEGPGQGGDVKSLQVSMSSIPQRTQSSLHQGAVTSPIPHRLQSPLPLPLPSSPVDRISPTRGGAGGAGCVLSQGAGRGAGGPRSGGRSVAAEQQAQGQDVAGSSSGEGSSFVGMASTSEGQAVDPSAYTSIRNNVTLSSLAAPDPGNLTRPHPDGLGASELYPAVCLASLDLI